MAAAAHGGGDVKISCSFVEIYNERVFDLLQPYKENKFRDSQDVVQRKAGLQLREDGRGRISIPELTQVTVGSCAAVLELLSKGTKNRTVRQTQMNEHSSRSHSILQLNVEQRSMGGGGGGGGSLTRSKLNLVDLAGSERWSAHHHEVTGGAMTDERERIGEMTSINQSLSTLATVIAALSLKDRAHVPYRDSKLTHLLQVCVRGKVPRQRQRRSYAPDGGVSAEYEQPTVPPCPVASFQLRLGCLPPPGTLHQESPWAL